MHFSRLLSKSVWVCYGVRMAFDKSLWHTLTDVDVENNTATCAQCGITKLARKRVSKTDYIYFVCGKHKNRIKRRRGPIHRRGLDLTKCSECGFVAVSQKQIDVHHINGNHYDNEPSNLQVLCANCHRLKD